MEIYKSVIPTPVGEMVALASSEGLMAFVNVCRSDYGRVMSRICVGNTVIEGDNQYTLQLKSEISEYFNKQRTSFDVKCMLLGTPFQQRAWRVLCEIPYGSTITYREQAIRTESPNGFRAVGRANGKNILEIIVPCHRVVAKNGSLGGFASGIDIKQLLLDHEK